MAIINQNARVAVTHQIAGEAWAQDNASQFIMDQLPNIQVNSLAEGYSGDITYRLVKLNQTMNLGGSAGPMIGGPGIAAPAPRGIDEDTVNFTYNSIITVPYRTPLRAAEPRLADAKNPGRLSAEELYNNVVQLLTNFLQNTTAHGSAKTFSGNPLNDLSDIANQNPIGDIETALIALRHYARGPLRTICIMDDRAIDIFRQRPEYHGAGVGSNSAGILDEDAFLGQFQRAHRLAAVLPLSRRVNIAAPGAVPTVTFGAGTAGIGGLVWFGNIDVRGPFDLKEGKTGNSSVNPDGALCFARADKFEMWEFDDILRRERQTYATWDCTFFAPRTSGQMSCFFTPGEVTNA